MNRLCPNLSLMWTNLPLADRFRTARDEGFEAVEFWPWEDAQVVRAAVAETGLSVSILNVFPGPDGSHGEMANPDAIEWWQGALDEAVQLAGDVGCTTINVLVGNRLEKFPLQDQLDTAARNLISGLERIDGSGIDLVIEPLGPDRATYLTRTCSEALAIRAAAGDHPRLQLLFDFYQLHTTEPKPLDETFRENVGRIKHVQVADYPGRHEPGAGEIDWSAHVRAMNESGYEGLVGLEFFPVGEMDAAVASSRAALAGLR